MQGSMDLPDTTLLQATAAHGFLGGVTVWADGAAMAVSTAAAIHVYKIPITSIASLCRREANK